VDRVDLFALVRAIEARDIGTVTRYVYFDEVRKSLTQQLVAAYIRRIGAQISPAAQSLAAAAPGHQRPVVNKLISPEALARCLLAEGWSVTVLPARPSTIGIASTTVGTVWQIFGNSEYDIGRFEVAAPAS
jgi:hypothetical protein